MSETQTLAGSDGLARCRWCVVTPAYPAYQDYHDREWGFPVSDDVRLFEKLCLESFQSGLSWRTILAKRENFRRAFDGFDFHRMARYDAARVDALLLDAGIVRHRGKIEAVVHNAACAVELQSKEGSLAAYFWRYEVQAAKASASAGVAAEAVALSKDLKKRGWKFVGATTAYAFMQAMGLVNDHVAGCVIAARASDARRLFEQPSCR